MDKQAYLEDIRQAAFEDELGKMAEGAMIPAAKIKASKPSARARAESRFKSSPIGRAASSMGQKKPMQVAMK